MAGPGMELIGEEEIREVLEVMRSGYLFRYATSPETDADARFLGKVYQVESEIARHCQVRYAVAVNSGTSALLTALAGLGIGPGDEVIVPGYTFIASLSSIIYSRQSPCWRRSTGRSISIRRTSSVRSRLARRPSWPST